MSFVEKEGRRGEEGWKEGRGREGRRGGREGRRRGKREGRCEAIVCSLIQDLGGTNPGPAGDQGVE